MEDFLTGVNTTALEAEELLCAIVVPVPRARREASYRRVARTVVDIALVSAAVSLTADAGTITDVRIALVPWRRFRFAYWRREGSCRQIPGRH